MGSLGYRVWSTGLETMINEYLDFSLLDSGSLRIRAFDGETAIWEEVDTEEYILMRSTGMFDINDVEIFEGDVVRCWSGREEDYLDFRELEGIVEYLGAGFAVDGNHLAWHAENIEVVGNIYQNSNEMGDSE